MSYLFFLHTIMEETVTVMIEISSLRFKHTLSSKEHCLLFMLTYTQIYTYFNSQDDKFEWTVGWKDN